MDGARVNQGAAANSLITKPIVVVGVPRSGTTWLFEILAAHPDASGAFETHIFTQGSGFRGLFMQLWWLEAFGDKQYGRLGVASGLAQLIDRSTLRHDIRRLVESWFSTRLQGGRRLVIKETGSDVRVIAEIFPDARFLHIVRDGRDVVVSHRAAERTWAPAMRPATGRSWAARARRWRRDVGEIQAELSAWSESWIQVRYEDLASEPLVALRQIFEFCELPYDDEIGERIVAKTAFSVHEQAGETRFRRQGKAGAWSGVLNPWQRMAFLVAAGDLLVELGYEPADNWRALRGVTESAVESARWIRHRVS